MRLRWFVLVMSAVSLTAGCTSAGPYPSREIDLIVPAEAGDTTDTVARAVAPCLADRLGVDVVVRNLPGEDGVLGNQALIDAKADGYTLMISSVSSTVVTPVLLPERPYYSEDLTFLGVVHSAPVVLFTAADSPVASAENLLATAKAGSPPVTVAHRGDKTVEGFTLWLLNSEGETRLESAPVDSDAGILRGVLAGDHDAGLATLTPELLSSIRAGEVRLLASGAHRHPEYLPEAPTIYEVLGRRFLPESLPNLVIDTAFSSPDYIGDARRRTLSSALARCLSTDAVRRDLGAEFVPEEQIEGGEQSTRYWELENGVQLGLNLPKVR